MWVKKRTRSLQNKVEKFYLNRREIRAKEEGSVLVIALLVSVAILIISMPFIFKLSGQYRSSNNSFHLLVAMNLSEAGVESAIWELNYGDITSWEGDSTQKTASFSSVQTSGGEVAGDFDVIVYDPEGSNPIVESTGRVNINDEINFTKTTRVVLQRRGATPLFNAGLFGNEGVILRQNFILEGDVQTNGISEGAITVYQNTTVTGDAICGTGGDPDFAIDLIQSAQVIGEQRASDIPKELNSIDVPEGMAFQGDYNSNIPVNLTNSSSGEYSSFTLDSGCSVMVTEDVTIHVTGEFKMCEATEIQIAEGARLTLYLSGSLDLDSNTDLNSDSLDATKLIILGTDDFTDTVTFDSNNSMYAGVYLPRADIVFSSNIEFNGSAIGNHMDVYHNVYVEYESDLADLGDFQGPEFYVLSWQEKKL
ncbi:hypothetical protein ACFLRW_05170 [Acidobacteriota bacterium]